MIRRVQCGSLNQASLSSSELAPLLSASASLPSFACSFWMIARRKPRTARTFVWGCQRPFDSHKLGKRASKGSISGSDSHLRRTDKQIGDGKQRLSWPVQPVHIGQGRAHLCFRCDCMEIKGQMPCALIQRARACNAPGWSAFLQHDRHGSTGRSIYTPYHICLRGLCRRRTPGGNRNQTAQAAVSSLTASGSTKSLHTAQC